MEALDKLKPKEQRELLNLIDLKVQNELLFQYIIDNKLPFCLPNLEKKPFEITNVVSNTLVTLIEMIKSGDLIKKDA